MNSINIRQLRSLAIACPLLFACENELEAQQVQIDFSASVGKEAFSCDKNYQLLSGHAPADLRFYVSDLNLIDDQGTAVPVTLDEGTDFQDAQFALIDFETGKGACQGDSLTNQKIIGEIAKGSYSGIEFEVSVPTNLNHSNPSEFPSLLQSPSMAWSWLLGFKYLKAEVASETGVLSVLHLGSTGCSRDNKPSDDAHQMQGSDDAHKMHGSDEDHQMHGSDDAHKMHGSDDAHKMHGSAGASAHEHDSVAEVSATGTPVCSNPNRIRVRLDNFRLGSSTIHLDFAKLFSGLDLDDEQQCHGSAGESSCAVYFDNVGLNLETGKPSEETSLFTLR